VVIGFLTAFVCDFFLQDSIYLLLELLKKMLAFKNTDFDPSDIPLSLQNEDFEKFVLEMLAYFLLEQLRSL